MSHTKTNIYILYKEVRDKYDIAMPLTGSVEYFIILFMSENVNLLKNLADYITEALSLRDSQLILLKPCNGHGIKTNLLVSS